jgi:adenine-specific DNA-methyltransferase
MELNLAATSSRLYVSAIVAHNDDEDMTPEPEMVKAYGDTWELGLHSYLTYLRDRLLLARELLTDSGSIFVQISDENMHHVRGGG